MIRIRPYEPGDAESMFEAVSESVAEIEPWMPWCHRGYSLSDARDWIERQIQAIAARTAFEFYVFDDDVFVGAVGLNQFDAANHRANLGYWVRTSKARRGYATAAVELLVRWAASTR